MTVLGIPKSLMIKSNLTLECISEGQPSSLKLTFGIELDFSHYSYHSSFVFHAPNTCNFT